jgi:hypothetical protein
MKRACRCSAKRIASSVAVSQACSAVTTSTCVGRSGDSIASATAQIQEGHALEAEPQRQFA